MDERKIEFFWDAASPYSYLAATQLDALAARTGATISWRPFLIGGAFKATGNTMPAAVPAKARYMRDDLRRWARRYGVPFNFPELFPLRSVLAQRVACAARARLPAASTLPLALMRAYWVDGCDLSQAEQVERVCTALGLDGTALLAAAESTEVKDQLRADTEEAVARGAFGAPTLFLGEHMFWGNDRLKLLEACLKGELEA